MQLTPRTTCVLEKLTVPRQDKERPTFDGNERFVAVSTIASHRSIARADEPIPYPPISQLT